MKKQTLTIFALAIGAFLFVTSCKKKETTPDSSDTTTSGTTSGTTTSGTTTSGTTTSGTTSGSTTSTIPNGLSPNQFKIGATVYSTTDKPAWHGFTGYLGYAGMGIGETLFKALFSTKNPATGTYKVVSVPTMNSAVNAGEIGIYAMINYSAKTITPNTGTAQVTNSKGVITITISDVTMGSDKFSAYYVIGDANRYIYINDVLADPTTSSSEDFSSNVNLCKIRTGNPDFLFYFGGSSTLNDGTYTSIAMPSSTSNIPANQVYVTDGNNSMKSDATSGTITVKDKKITFTNFTIKSPSGSIKITGEWQF